MWLQAVERARKKTQLAEMIEDFASSPDSVSSLFSLPQAKKRLNTVL